MTERNMSEDLELNVSMLSAAREEAWVRHRMTECVAEHFDIKSAEGAHEARIYLMRLGYDAEDVREIMQKANALKAQKAN